MRLVVFIIFSAVLAAALQAIVSPSLKPVAPFRVGATVWPGYEPLFLARQLGKLDHFPGKLVEFQNTPEAIRSFQNGALEAVALSSDEFLRLAAEQPDVRAILVMDYSNGADALVAHPEFHKVSDLKGKRVGVELNGVGVYILTRALQVNGLALSDVRIVPLSLELHEQALVSGEVDAVVTFEPRLSRLEAKGCRVLFDSSRIPNEVADFLVVRKATLESQRPQLEELLESWFDAKNYLETNTTYACELMATRERLGAADFCRSLQKVDIPSRARNRRILHFESAATYESLRKIREVMIAAHLPIRPLPGPEILHGGLVK